MEHYKFEVPSLFKGLNADDVGAEFKRIKEKHRTINKSLIVEESKNEDSYLHEYFEWDNEKAADKWREEQARLLIKNIKVTVVNETIECSVRAFVHTVTTDCPTRSYVPIQEVINDETAYKDLVSQIERDYGNFKSKYAIIEELHEGFSAMDEAIKKIKQQ